MFGESDNNNSSFMNAIKEQLLITLISSNGYIIISSTTIRNVEQCVGKTSFLFRHFMLVLLWWSHKRVQRVWGERTRKFMQIELSDFCRFTKNTAKSQIVSLPLQHEVIFLSDREVIWSVTSLRCESSSLPLFFSCNLYWYCSRWNDSTPRSMCEGKQTSLLAWMEKSKIRQILKLQFLWGNFLSVKRLSSAQSKGTLLLAMLLLLWEDIYDT